MALSKSSKRFVRNVALSLGISVAGIGAESYLGQSRDEIVKPYGTASNLIEQCSSVENKLGELEKKITYLSDNNARAASEVLVNYSPEAVKERLDSQNSVYNAALSDYESTALSFGPLKHDRNLFWTYGLSSFAGSLMAAGGIVGAGVIGMRRLFGLDRN